LSISCSNPQAPATPEELFKENPVSVNLQGSVVEPESYSTQVSVYSMNNRKDSHLTQVGGYRLTYKKIDGIAYSRVDMEAEYNGGVSRAVITNGSDAVLVNNDSGEVETRFTVEEEEDTGLNFLETSPITGRVNLDSVREGAKRLSLDLAEDTEAGSIVLEIPSNYFAQQAGLTRLSTKISFDIANEALDEVEIVTVDDEGVVVTSTVTNVYEEVDGEIIKVGTITVIDTDNPNKVTGFADDVETFESMDDIPELSQAEYDALVAEGLVNDTEGITFGSPEDLSSVETIVELYTSIEVNGVEDSVFRFILGE